MRRIFLLLLALCLIFVTACGQKQAAGDVSSEDAPAAQQSSSAAEPELSVPAMSSQAEEPDSSSSHPEPEPSGPPEQPPPDAEESSEPEEEEPFEPDMPPNAPVHEEKGPEPRDIKQPGDAEITLEVLHSDIDPGDNSFIITLDDAYEIVAKNIRNIEFIPQRYGVSIERVDQIDGEYYYHVWIYNAMNYNTVGFYYVHNKTGEFFRHDYQSLAGRLLPVT